jgi:hypothetical protein
MVTLQISEFTLSSLAYHPPAISTFLSEQISNQPTVLFSQNKPAPAASHQPNEHAVSLLAGHVILCCLSGFWQNPITDFCFSMKVVALTIRTSGIRIQLCLGT